MTISEDPADSNPFPFTPNPLPHPRPIRVNGNQASRADSHEEVEESTNKHIQDPEVAAIRETLVRIEPKVNFLFNEKKTLQRTTGSYVKALNSRRARLRR